MKQRGPVKERSREGKGNVQEPGSSPVSPDGSFTSPYIYSIIDFNVFRYVKKENEIL